MRPLSHYLKVDSLPVALEILPKTQKHLLIKMTHNDRMTSATMDSYVDIMLRGSWPESVHLFIDNYLNEPQAEKIAQAIATGMLPPSFEIHYGSGSYYSRRAFSMGNYFYKVADALQKASLLKNVGIGFHDCDLPIDDFLNGECIKYPETLTLGFYQKIDRHADWLGALGNFAYQKGLRIFFHNTVSLLSANYIRDTLKIKKLQDPTTPLGIHIEFTKQFNKDEESILPVINEIHALCGVNKKVEITAPHQTNFFSKKTKINNNKPENRGYCKLM